MKNKTLLAYTLLTGLSAVMLFMVATVIHDLKAEVEHQKQVIEGQKFLIKEFSTEKYSDKQLEELIDRVFTGKKVTRDEFLNLLGADILRAAEIYCIKYKVPCEMRANKMELFISAVINADAKIEHPPLM